MSPTTPYLRMRLRSMAEAIADIAEGKDSRIDIYDDPPRIVRKMCLCGAKLETSQERWYGECWFCLRANA